MSVDDARAVSADLARVARQTQGLDLLLLFGSRSRGQAHDRSDWDLGYLGTGQVGVDRLLADLVTVLGTDRVDLVDLSRGSGVLRYRAACDGQVIFERTPGIADGFRLEAVGFWCDVEPVLRAGYASVLADLDR